LQLVTFEKPDKKTADGAAPATPADDEAADDEESTNRLERFDPIKIESLNILNDLIDLSRNPKTATASTAK